MSRRRGELGLSLETVGELADIAPADIAALERGAAELPEIDTLVRLAGGLEVPPGDLIAGTDWAPDKGGSGEFRIDQSAP